MFNSNKSLTGRSVSRARSLSDAQSLWALSLSGHSDSLGTQSPGHSVSQALSLPGTQSLGHSVPGHSVSWHSVSVHSVSRALGLSALGRHT